MYLLVNILHTLVPKVKIFVEDSYGEEAIKILVDKLKDIGIVNKKILVDIKPIPGLCSSKFSRIIRASAIEFDRVIIVVDGDGNPQNIIKRERKHIPPDNILCNKVHILVNKYEIEEWIIYALYGKISSNPSEKLKELTNGIYRKSYLPRYIEKIINNEHYLSKLLSYEVVEKLVFLLQLNI